MSLPSPLRFLLPLLVGLTALPLSGQETGTRFAMVNMEELISKYHRTITAQAEIQEFRGTIDQQNEQRIKAIKVIQEEVQGMQAGLEDPTISEKKKREIYGEMVAKTEEGAALDRERLEFLSRRERALDENATQRMTLILQEIHELVKQQADRLQIDFVFDVSGMSAGGVPFLVHHPSSKTADLTAGLLEILNKDAPKAAPPAPAK